MARREIIPLSGMVLDDELTFTLGELARACGLHADALIEMVQEGLLEPCGRSPRTWRFPAHSLRRVQTALRLQRDLEVNLAGAALVLDLLDEVRELRARVRVLECHLFHSD